MSETRNNKAHLYMTVIFILLLVVVFVYFVRPLRTEAADTNTALAVKQKQYEALRAKSEQNPGISDVDKLKLEQVRRQVPEQPYVESIIRDLRRLEVVSQTQMKQYSISIGNTAVAVKTEEKNENANEQIQQASGEQSKLAMFAPVRIETSFTGTYEQIYKMLAQLESLDRIFQVDTMSLSRKQDPLVHINADEPIVSTLTLVTYYSPELQNILKPYNVDYTVSDGRSTPFN